ncbi:LysR family transcriptional regulator [Cognatishimia sp. WU-CL00825]|uniref:LysR family transcriptional regulator n=1 Tax=Cognatishimia sp. WU-CL00825 TaxID=3127658 RepID=UPI00336538C2
MIDRLRQMAIFAKTIDHGSFRGAAGALNLSPSVVSHHISQLEEHLGVALIYRSTRKLALTREGESLLAATRKMLEAAEGELQNLTTQANSPSGELRITLPSVLSQSRLVDQITAFALAYPRIQIALDFSDTQREMIDDGFDIAIRMGPHTKNTATSRNLFQVRRVLIASSDYLAKQPPVKTPSGLANWDWVSLFPVQNTPHEFKDQNGQSVLLKPKSQLSTNDAQSLYRLARAGAGLAIVPEVLAKDDVIRGKVQYVLPEWQLPSLSVFAVWPANAPKHGLIHLALNAFKQAPQNASH